MAEVIVIPASKELESTESVKKTVRVAAYCRVSSLPQEESYSAQEEHFKSIIEKNLDWELVKVYGDEGVTGLNTKHRVGFQQMLADGKKGKFDLLLVKSISRLGRNTVDFLTALRILRASKVTVCFEKEGIKTDDSVSEMIITIWSAFAQMESESISQNVQIGLGYRMQRGEWSVAYSTFLGYDRTAEGEVVINLEEAETIRCIFDWFLEGMSLDHISKRLIMEGRKTGKGTTSWNKGSVQRILNNRKYAGDVVMQLTVMDDLLNKKRVKNKGQAPQYVVENGIPAIIPKQIYLLAQGEMERRGHIISKDKMAFEGPDIRSYKNEFTGRIICPVCGANYRRVNGRIRYVWKCRNRIVGDCTGEILSAEELRGAVLSAEQLLWDTQPEIINDNIRRLSFHDDNSVLMQAAILHTGNMKKQQLREFLSRKRPEEYDIGLMKDIVERIDFTDKDYIIHFFAGQDITVPRSSITPVRLDASPDKQRDISEDAADIDMVPEMTSVIENNPEFITRYDVTGKVRRRLVDRLEKLTRVKAKYLRFPTMAYRVGDYIVTREGAVIGEMSQGMRNALSRCGFNAVSCEEAEPEVLSMSWESSM
ncbi:MAG TPA: hypothetical protein DCL38_10910 [Lachnospiraceae bacterium]|nr:hypothetical protein [Lachnospiraceae bacterium]